MSANDRSGHEVYARIATVSFSLVKIRQWAVWGFAGLVEARSKRVKNSSQKQGGFLPVAVSLTHRAMLSRMAVLVFLLVIAAAKNSQSLFV